jgi:hypothetical protein
LGLDFSVPPIPEHCLGKLLIEMTGQLLRHLNMLELQEKKGIENIGN